MDPFDGHYYKVNRKVMSLLGLWYTKANDERLFRLYIIGAMLFYFIFIQFCELLTVDSDLLSILLILQTFIPAVCVANIYCIYVVKHVSVQKILSYITEDCRRLQDEAEMKIMQKHIYECKVYTFISGFICILFASFYALPPVFHRILSLGEGKSGVDRFPIFSCHDYFLDPESYYYPILIYQLIVIAVECTVLLCCCSGYFIVVKHVCALLLIIKSRIRKQFINNHCDDNFYAIQLDHLDWIIDIAQRLARSREIITLMNTAFENYYLFQILLACILVVLSISCIPVLLKHAESQKEICMFILFIIGSLSPIYVSCLIGQKLIDCSMDVYNEACLIPIHNISVKTQKLLLMMIILNDKPIKMSIGKVFISSHQFFQSLVRMALSFAMMLHSTQSI